MKVIIKPNVLVPHVLKSGGNLTIRCRKHEAVQRFRDQDCAYFPAGATCATDRAAIARLADAMQKDLDRTAPWAAEVEDLADKTASRLAAVAILAEDPKRPANMIDTELTLLTRDLQSWSAYGG